MQDRIRDILNHKSRNVWCVSRDASISEAAHRMRDHHIGTLMVVDRNEPVGMLSEHDIVSGVLACDKDPGEVHVSAIMTAVPIVRLETTIEDAAALAAAAGAHQIVVVDEDRIVGVIAAKEMANWVSHDRAFQISDLTGYITGRAAPPRDAVSLFFDEAPILETSCAYCGTTEEEASWDLGVALCLSCAPSEPVRWSPYGR